MDKRIEIIEVRVGDLKFGFGNPRKITKKKLEELWESMNTFGDFGVIVIEENYNVISGTQRATTIKAKKGDDEIVLCKMLIGYTQNELKAINIKANTHAGDWDLDKLAEWTADLNIGLNLELPQIDIDERKIKDMELIRYEKYDYVMIVCRNEIDYLNLTRNLGIDDKKVLVAKNATKERKIKARAIWYDDIKAQIIPKVEK